MSSLIMFVSCFCTIFIVDIVHIESMTAFQAIK